MKILVILAATAMVASGLTLVITSLPWGHRHRHKLSSVSYPPVPGGVIGVFNTAMPDKTNLVYRCCDRPGGLLAVSLLGFWRIEQLADVPEMAEYTRGGEAQTSTERMPAVTSDDLWEPSPEVR